MANENVDETENNLTENENTILVITGGMVVRRGGSGPRALAVDVLADNMSSFIEKIGSILTKTPDKIGSFQISEFTISAEISAEGKLTILGVGGEAGTRGGLTFTFKRI
jgi:hypothetical protein